MWQNSTRFEDEEEKTPNESAESKKPPLGELMRRKFLDERKLFFWGEVDDKRCRQATEELLYLEAIDPGKEILGQEILELAGHRHNQIPINQRGRRYHPG